jgi:hypothetical protein
MIPTYEELDRDLKDIEGWLQHIRPLWRVALPDGFRRPKRGDRDAVSGGSPADLADLVTDTESYRAKLHHAARELRDARTRVRSAVADLNDALAKLDQHGGPEVADVQLLAPLEGRKEQAQAKAAQQRRLARAEASGDYSEVWG